MSSQQHRYRLKRNLFSPRVALSAGPRGLTEHLRLGRSRTTPWTRVTGVRWLRHGEAEVRLRDRRPIRLPQGTPDIDALVAAIEQQAEDSQRQREEVGIPHNLIRGWLEIGARGAWSHNSNYLAALGGFGLGIALAVVVYSASAPLLQWLGWSAVLALLSVGCYAVSGRGTILSADGRSLSCQVSGRAWEVEWHDIRAVHGEIRPVLGLLDLATVRLATNQGPRRFTALARGLGPLLRTLERTAEINGAAFHAAGDEPIPDTSLSPARLTDEPAERGLSRAGR
ncbi:MAG: hypothetical protein HZB16_20840 [Armatimonadetes bacterium]|nr:hypothetical protein [Armatimonadota bacterium]